MKHMMESKSNDDRDRQEGSIYEVNFGYHPVTKVYTKPSSHIPELSEIMGRIYNAMFLLFYKTQTIAHT